MAIRCKFTCNYIQPQVSNGEVIGAHITMTPVTDGSDENKKFFKYTPGGQLLLYTINNEAAAQLEMGKQYYLDISAAEQSGTAS